MNVHICIIYEYIILHIHEDFITSYMMVDIPPVVKLEEVQSFPLANGLSNDFFICFRDSYLSINVSMLNGDVAEDPFLSE